ncbi:alcohol dehydrogenase IV [Mycena albidolilacea]|uniref:Alcohol dehydrogenase IV n=1 Tax=Mycena albidolilacea TaxID=1033008 RepID=A0AAD7ATJ0_9AGAR|nr:alcohol dehydrogenase IV [Mycena albidolilacea]
MSALSGSYGWVEAIKSVNYGPGSVATALPELIQLLGVKKALLVTGRSLSTKTDVVKKVEDILKAHGSYAGTFTDFGEHTPVAGINACIEQYQETGADFIVALGGGSPIDGAKAVRFRIHEQTGAPLPPQIAIPTTLSAAEYTIGAGYTDEDGEKVAVSHQLLAPAGVILDAELTLPTPSRLWLSTGIRALDHSVENLYRPLIPHPVKILCYAAMADLFKYLPISKADPTNVEVRQKLLVATWMSIWPTYLEEYSALGPSHSLGHRLGAKYSIPHGITSCLTLAPVVKIQARTASKEDKEYLANALFYLRESSTGSIEGDILKLSALISGLIEKLGLTSSLSEYKVPKEDFQRLAEDEDDLVEVLNSIY